MSAVVRFIVGIVLIVLFASIVLIAVVAVAVVTCYLFLLAFFEDGRHGMVLTKI